MSKWLSLLFKLRKLRYRSLHNLPKVSQLVEPGLYDYQPHFLFITLSSCWEQYRKWHEFALPLGPGKVQETQDRPAKLCKSSPGPRVSSCSFLCSLKAPLHQRLLCTALAPWICAGTAETPCLPGLLDSWFANWDMHSQKYYDLV